jgi:nucleoside phosphorylase
MARSRYLPDLLDYTKINAKYGLITILEVEFLAIKYVFGGVEPLRINMGKSSLPLEYWLLTLKGEKNREDISVICCKPIMMGNNAAAIASTALILQFPSIEAILVCGIAAGMPVNLGAEGRSFTTKEMERHVCIGDVVVADRGIFQYDLISIKDDNKIDHRVSPLPAPPFFSPQISSLKRDILENKIPWFDYIEKGYKHRDCVWQKPDLSNAVFFPMYRAKNGKIIERKKPQAFESRGQFPYPKPFIHFGLIGSANILLRNFEFRDRLCKEHKILAVEMEGSGVSDAAWTLGKAALVIRGACDFGDRRKNDAYHQYAAMSAASVLKILLSRTQ